MRHGRRVRSESAQVLDFPDPRVPKLIAGYDPNWRERPAPALPPEPSRRGWGRSDVVVGQRYETSEVCNRPGRTIHVRTESYDCARGRWKCVVVRSGIRKRGDIVYRTARDLLPETDSPSKGTPP